MSAENEEVMKPCGECSMCCKLLQIVKADNFPFDKPAGQWCKHCNPGKGCGIFNTPDLPILCKTYHCGWQANFDWPDYMRPDKCHAIFSKQEDFEGAEVIHVVFDPTYPQNEGVLGFIRELRQRGVILYARYGPGPMVLYCKDEQVRGRFMASVGRQEVAAW